jgi:glycine hydroxymethyltransferase
MPGYDSESPTASPHLVEYLQAIAQEERRVANLLPLAANENCMSDLAKSFHASGLSEKYLLGTLADRKDRTIMVKGDLMLNGLTAVSDLEACATAVAKRLFAAEAVEFRPLSGVHAMMCSLLALTDPGDVVYSIDPLNGGHFATRHLLQRMGRPSQYLPWDEDNWTIDVNALRTEVTKTNQKTAIFLDHGTPLFPLPITELKDALGKTSLVVYDASHTLGLMAGGHFQCPLTEGADVLQGNTHKTLPGPQKGMILTRDTALGDQLSDALCSGLVSSQHTHHAIALYITLLEMGQFGRAYARQAVENAQVLAEALRQKGFQLVARHGLATASHLLLIKGFPEGEGYAACHRLLTCGISANARRSSHGEILRIGTQEMTRRGMGPTDMRRAADLIGRALRTGESAKKLQWEVEEFMLAFKEAKYSFDAMLHPEKERLAACTNGNIWPARHAFWPNR